MSPQAYTALPESVTRRLLEAAEADRTRGSATSLPEATVSSPVDYFVTEWSLMPDHTPPPLSGGRISPMDATRIELEHVLQRDTGSPSLH